MERVRHRDGIFGLGFAILAGYILIKLVRITNKIPDIADDIVFFLFLGAVVLVINGGIALCVEWIGSMIERRNANRALSPNIAAGLEEKELGP